MQEPRRSILNSVYQALRTGEPAFATCSLSVYQIADRCGYYDSSHFHRRFQREFGLGPLHFRRLARREP